MTAIDTGSIDRRARPLTEREHAAVNAVGAAVGALGLLGFVNSFAAVERAAWPSFGPLAPTVPLGIDLGIAIFAALDIVLARLDMRPRWVRLVPWSLTGATVYLNTAAQATWFGRIAHAVLPALWVAAVEVAAHVVRVRAGLAAGTRMDRIRPSRWLLAPVRTVCLWRRMVLWEIRSYQDALRRERDRLLALTGLQDAHGTFVWRWRAPRRVRALYKLGELTPARGEAGPPPAPPRDRKTGRLAAPRPRKTALRRAAVPDVDALMPLGWRIAADLDTRGQPLTRDTLAAALRAAGHGAGNERVGALLARLKTEAPADLAEIPALTEGGEHR